MTDYKTLNTVLWSITAIVLIGASLSVPLSAAAAESVSLSKEFHAAAAAVTDRFKDELRLELAETIRPPTALRVSLVVASGQTDDDEQKDQLLSSHEVNAPRENDTSVHPTIS